MTITVRTRYLATFFAHHGNGSCLLSSLARKLPDTPTSGTDNRYQASARVMYRAFAPLEIRQSRSNFDARRKKFPSSILGASCGPLLVARTIKDTWGFRKFYLQYDLRLSRRRDAAVLCFNREVIAGDPVA